VKAMDEKIVPNEMFTNNNTTKVKDEKVYDEKANDENTWEGMDAFVVIDLLHISKTYEQQYFMKATTLFCLPKYYYT
jgi:hypothetical protein